MSSSRIRVLVADDSLVAREMLCQILASDNRIEVIGQARDGSEAVDMCSVLQPDLVTMDIHMPRMDGLAATEQIMAFTPTPILVVSSSVHGNGIGRAFDALSAGALEVVKKPEPRDWSELEHIAREIIHSVRVLSGVRVVTHIRGRRERPEPPTGAPHRASDSAVVAIGASTGGPSALLEVLSRLPSDLGAAVLVAQHIADGFVPGLASWLSSVSSLDVVVADESCRLEPGTVYLAPTDADMCVDDRAVQFRTPGDGRFYVPSIDVLFESVAESYGASSVGVILTGMGTDGAAGMKRMHDAGALTIAQDESSSTVFGMPKAAADLGAVSQVLPVERVAETIVEAIGV
jgi:two-component system chemotaxis response regulator CheB